LAGGAASNRRCRIEIGGNQNRSESAMASILIIDDDEAVRRTARIILVASGFEVVAVPDGKAGINAVKEQPFDLVIVDLFMPGIDGLATTKGIRKADPRVPIITVSGFMFGGTCPEMPNFQAMAVEAGATSSLYKPFRPKELVQAVQNALGVTA
jgi:CheY-like chemotaxis protein